MQNVVILPSIMSHRGGLRRSLRPLLSVTIPMVVLSQALGMLPAQAAGISPLPALARALTHVTSYQVTISMAGPSGARTGARRRSTGTRRPGAFRGLGLRGSGTQTIVAVRKGTTFEDYVTIKGIDAAGKPTVTELVILGAKVCARTNRSGSFTCRTRTATGRFNFSFDPTPTLATAGASAAFTRAGTKSIGGQSCDAYRYTNKTPFSSATGVLYVSHAISLPCEQDATVIRQSFTGSGTITQKSTTIWSRFNDPSLRIPAVPTA